VVFHSFALNAGLMTAFFDLLLAIGKVNATCKKETNSDKHIVKSIKKSSLFY